MGRMSALYDPQLNQLLVAKVTQATTAAPAWGTKAVDGLNAGTPVLARTSAGIYTLTLTGAFTAGKTFVRVTPSKATPVVCNVVYTSADVVTLNFSDVATPSAADSGDFDITIEIYN